MIKVDSVKPETGLFEEPMNPTRLPETVEKKNPTNSTIGDNTGSMSLKGADPAHDGEPRPDRWMITPDLDAVARRWGIEPERDLRHLTAAAQ